ncbi:tyrosine-type recombinase/integrase [Natrinema hispanicum]|uniref:Phage integrase family protein n=1 Tax=Natrinema hispanicum TaxID=392421 RepID=A0A1I0DNN4_9EURY|nr:tyrosine-type recombinase/integrase [Natrinema hispanicum]SDD73110.1 Phage integrase family protein [Natrinema hispanicum]SET34149.1 Phage integrase family protein [Natrinema hispanicum]
MTSSKSPAAITEALRRELGDAAEDVQRTYSDLHTWMINKGENPRREIGLSESTAENYLDRLDQLHRFSITYFDPDDPTKIEDEHADALLLMIDRAEITKQRGKNKGEEYGESTKRKFADTLGCYFRWQYYEGAMDYEWEPKINFSDEKGESAYRFTYRELGLLFEEAESYGALPSYYDTPVDEREKIDGLVAQRLGIPKEDVTRNDWLHADWSGKVHSMVAVGFDAGLAPIEIGNAETHWYDPKSNTLKIPTEFACKEREKEEVGLSDRSGDVLSEWFQERRHLEKYDGSNKIWLNREGNPYQSGSLCNLLRNLCEEAGIKTDDRKIVWYSLRQTMGRNVTAEGELSEANDQLRHERYETTQEAYNQTPVEKLQLRLNETQRKAEKAAADPEYNPFAEEVDATSSTATTNTQPAQETNETTAAVSKTNGGGLHIDAVISDTTEARVDITRQILQDGTEE